MERKDDLLLLVLFEHRIHFTPLCGSVEPFGNNYEDSTDLVSLNHVVFYCKRPQTAQQVQSSPPQLVPAPQLFVPGMQHLAQQEVGAPHHVGTHAA